MIVSDKKYIGVTFLDMQYNLHTVECFSEKYNGYLIIEEGMSENHRGIMNESEIEFYLNKQPAIIESKIKMEEREKAEKEKQDQAEREYNNVYGYCDNMSNLQKGKVLKILNKTFLYNGKVTTRKNFIYDSLMNGYRLDVIKTMITGSRKVQGERIDTIKENVPALKNDHHFYEITKTEYDYGMYLLANKI